MSAARLAPLCIADAATFWPWRRWPEFSRREIPPSPSSSCRRCAGTPPASPPAAGGTESDRPFDVPAAHATHNSDYFKRCIRNPKGLVATAKMEPHPHYSASQLADLAAFLRAE